MRDVLPKCDDKQIRFCVYWLYLGDRDEAARKLGIDTALTYRDPFNENVVRLYNALMSDPAIAAKSIIQHNAVKAAMVQIRLMDSENEIVRLKASESILKRAVPDELPVVKTEQTIYKIGIDLQMLQTNRHDDLEKYSVEGEIIEGEYRESPDGSVKDVE